jgi:TRAP-type C4-dicarboxylate transport system permease small subunit
MHREGPSRLSRAAARWNRAEDAVLGGLVGAMVILAALQIVLRNVFKIGISWVEPFLGAALLWLTMLGALAATGARKHITIDLASHFLSGRPRQAAAAATHAFAAFVCGWLVHAGVRFVALQKEMAIERTAGVPQWMIYAVVPVCFALLAARFLIHAALCARAAAARSPNREDARP